MKTRYKIYVLTCAIIISVTLTATSFIINRNRGKTVSKANTACTYCVKMVGNDICLFENNEVIKKYNIDANLLPGEDQLLLIEGIKVDSISDADLLAEDYDG